MNIFKLTKKEYETQKEAFKLTFIGKHIRFIFYCFFDITITSICFSIIDTILEVTNTELLDTIGIGFLVLLSLISYYFYLLFFDKFLQSSKKWKQKVNS